MADAVTTFVDALHVELAKSTLHGSAVPYVVGRKHWKGHSQPPLIRWGRGRIASTDPKKTGGISNEIARKRTQIDLIIWMESEDSCDLMLDNVIRAARIAAGGGDNLGQWAFDWMTEEHPGYEHLGAALFGFLQVDLPLTASPIADVLVTITSQTHTQELDPQ